MAVVYDFGNSQNWGFLWGGEAIARPVPAKALGKYYPIDNIKVPIQAASEVIAVFPESTSDPGNWKYAGVCLQKVNTGITGGGVADGYIGNKKIWLKQINILRFQRVSTTYSIEFKVPWWLRQISYEVWEYTGLIEDTIETQLVIIDEKLDELL